MIIVDTNVVSETSKPAADPKVVEWLAANRALLWMPTNVLAELHYGVEKLFHSRKRQALENWLLKLRRSFEDRILVFDERAAIAHGKLRAHLRKIGKTMDAPDSFLAAVALSTGTPVATRNTKHFEQTGVELVNPWED